MSHFGKGGQAKQMRDEPNAVEIVTKRYPGMEEHHFFTDDDYIDAVLELTTAFARLEEHLLAGGTVIMPEDGVGTNRAELERRSPRIWNYIQDRFARLHYIAHPPPARSA